MYRLIQFRVAALLSLLFVILLASSCVNEKYDMSGDRLNLEVTPFREGVRLPLGSTDSIKLSRLLKDVDAGFLNNNNGVYSLSLSDNLDMSDKLGELTGLVDIPDVDFSREISFELNDVDVSDVKLEAKDYPFSYELASGVEVPEVVIPKMPEDIVLEPELAKFAPKPEDLHLKFDPIEHDQWIMKLKNIPTIPDGLKNDDEISVEEGPYASLLDRNEEVDIIESISFDMNLPKGIRSVHDIVMKENAGIRITVHMDPCFIKKGSVVPGFIVDLSGMLDVEGHADDLIDLSSLALSESNNYTQSEVYGISALKVHEDHWTFDDEGAHLHEDYSVECKGNVHFEHLVTTTNLLSDPDHAAIHINVKIEFVNFEIVDFAAAFDPVEVSDNRTVRLSMDEIPLPEEVERISYAEFTEESGLSISMKAQNVENMPEFVTTLKELKITFPKEYVVDGADPADNSVMLDNEDMTEGFDWKIHISRVNLPAPVDGKMNFAGDILIDSKVVASGELHSSYIMDGSKDPVSFLVSVDTDFEVADYQVTMNPYTYELDIEPQDIVVDIPDNLKDMKELVVYPEGSPEISIDLNFPEMPLNIIPAADKGLSISFPKMLRFTEDALPNSYNYDPVAHSITFRGTEAIPEEIVLPVEKLVVTPEQDPADNKYYAKGRVEITGGVTLEGGNLSKADVENLTAPGKEVSVVAHIPEIKPQTLAIDKYESTITEDVTLDLLSADEIPEQLVSLDLIELENADINILIDAGSLPELGTASLAVNIDVKFPEILKVEDADENGNMKFSGTLGDDNMIVFPPVKVKSLNLSGVDIKNGISENLSVSGTIVLNDATLDIDEWLGRDLKLNLEAGLKDVLIGKIVGKVDYEISPVVQEVEIGDLADGFEDMGMEVNLDFNHAHLALEVETNLGVPVTAHVELIPYYGGQPGEKTVKADLELDPEKLDDNVARFWLAEKVDNRCPQNYELVEVENLLSIFKNIPEKLEVKLTGGTDSSKDCVLEPSDSYSLKINYLFELPLEFGEEFEVTYRDTLSGIPEIVGSVLSKGNRIMLGGEISNSLPLALDLKLNFLDSDGEQVPLADECGEQHIAPCGLDGKASKTELKILIALEDGVDAGDIESVELMFDANSGGVVGVPVTEDAYLQAVLQAVLPDGVTVDLKEIMNSDEQ